MVEVFYGRHLKINLFKASAFSCFMINKLEKKFVSVNCFANLEFAILHKKFEKTNQSINR